MIRPDTRLIILTNLHNPSGAWLDGAALDAVAGVVEQAGVPCIIDEVYAGYGPADAVAGSALSRSELFIAVNSLTKVYGLPSLRCGWIAAAPRFIASLRDHADRHQFAVSRLAHAIGALVLENRAPFEAHWRSAIVAARAVFEPRLAAWREKGLVELELPEHGCMFFPRVPAVPDTLAFAEWLIDAHGVMVAPGEFFGLGGHVRLGFSGSPTEVEEGLDRLERGLREFGA
jgi:aspartate/methionine/tyrosine aminotransferase